MDVVELCIERHACHGVTKPHVILADVAAAAALLSLTPLPCLLVFLPALLPLLSLEVVSTVTDTSLRLTSPDPAEQWMTPTATEDGEHLPEIPIVRWDETITVTYKKKGKNLSYLR